MKIKVIEMKKYYRWIGIFVTCMMCIMSFRILILDTKDIMIAKANGARKGQSVVQANREENIKDRLFIQMLNKTIPLLEVNYEKENGYSHDKTFIKLVLGKIINFDYEDPKTLFKAQISMLKEADDDLAEMDDYKVLKDQGDNIAQNNFENNSLEEVNRNQVVRKTKEIQEVATGSTNVKVENIKKENETTNKNTASIPIVSSAVKTPNKVKLNMSKPVVFVYHTHATESYMPESIGNFHSLNRKFTVRVVGDQLTSYLTHKGYNVIHNDTLHDYPSYQQSYIRSLETLKTNMNKNPSLKIIFDIHRDAAPNNSSARKNSYVVIDGQKVARYSIVVGTGNKNAEKLLTFAEYIKARSDELYPGLAKKTITKPYRFNQFNSDYYALIEIGNTANNIDEAVRTTKYLSQVLDQVIKDIKR
ncbi:stage II sporulation protein P [Crassaminicella profunda]|uniref:stage II sporulation protein P n=1 Tax=Crassaminicella profunda TaxID=1286698 RepID=UPI001CA75929|nr:stage II sporulation protein P [Crassaminicella profunda]QZY56534.1 stage II sporulation protein P [Crassaminicella profunda]